MTLDALRSETEQKQTTSSLVRNLQRQKQVEACAMATIKPALTFGLPTYRSAGISPPGGSAAEHDQLDPGQ